MGHHSSCEWVGLIRLWVDPYFFTCNFYIKKNCIVFFYVITNKRINKKNAQNMKIK